MPYGNLAAQSCLDRHGRFLPAEFWRKATILAPFAAAAVPFFGTMLLGGFDDFKLVGREVSALEAFGILGTMCFPMAACLAAQRWYNEAMSSVARTWPAVPGTIRSSTTERRATLSAVLWALDVRYDYTVGGRSHSDTRLAFAPRFVADKDLIFRLAEKYPVGATVTVHHDALLPEEAIQETSEDLARGSGGWRVWLLLAVPFLGALFMALRHM